ncbi:uncharacterized protein [Apostichopus japonicus]
MDYMAMLLILLVCHEYKGFVSSTSPVLCFKTGNVSEVNISCDAEPGDDVCLVCPVKISTNPVTWSRNGNFIYSGLNKLHEEATILQNTCDPVLSSIQLKNISLDQFNDAYECLSDKELVTAYILKITTYPSLSIENNVRNELDEEITSLICRADNVLAPITLTWFVNEQRESEELFSETNDHSVTSTFSFNQYVNATTVKCQVNGSHIKPASLTYTTSGPGEVPSAGLSKQQLEEKIRQAILLAQPICCPGALCSIMLLCWNTTKDCRPNFQTILEKVSTLLKTLN